MPAALRPARPSPAVRRLLALGWAELNARLLETDDEALLVAALFHERRRAPARSEYVRRLYARYAVVRRARELRELGR